jgi:energy-coupling factor transport system substrate-specific component
MSLSESLRKDFTTITVVLIPVAIALNVAIGGIVRLLALPIFLDTIGTVFVAVVAGPWAGALTGILTNVFMGLAVDPGWFPWFGVSAVIGLTAGLLGIWGLFRSWGGVIASGVIIALVTIVASSITNLVVYGGLAPDPTVAITAFFLEQGLSDVAAVFATNFILEPIDKVATVLLAYAILRGLSGRYLARLPRAENTLS